MQYGMAGAFLAAAAAAGFVTTLVLTPEAMTFLQSSGIVGIDQQKEDRPELPTSGGVAVIFGFLAAVSLYIGLTTFVPGAPTARIELVLAALASTFIIAFIGLIDDIHVDRQEGVEEKGNHQIRIGLAQKYKSLAPAIAALPLMAVKAGTATMHLPFLGAVPFGVLYPLLLVPVAVTCVVNATNMLAGQNGLESALGTIALAAVGVFAFQHGEMEGAAIALGMAAPLAAFWYYNRYPARILPGDSLTYAVGAAYVSATIIANVELFAGIVFLPWIVEAFLKLRSGFQASSLGELQQDETLKPQHDSIYSLTHVFMRFDVSERQLVRYAAALELVVVAAAFAVFG
ncbi:MAG: hypothetical protein SVW02_01110 [Candidatus Nanohaloarchaea archaeon]|nr:hypothetical protein [Candidatus Nanohaloarchaea archaeon]